ncbi:MAG: ECF-type sigma factor [Verrucomicrobiales bacterium]
MDELPGSSAEDLLPEVYHELRRLAAARIQGEAHEFTLQATALVHEAWIKLAGEDKQQWASRGHFFGAAAETMRRILIDRARRRHRVRHGGSLQRVELDSVDVAVGAPDEVLLRLDDALEKLAAESPEKTDLVKLRFYMGLSIEEAAKMLGISAATAKRRWVYARAWLFAEMRRAE